MRAAIVTPEGKVGWWGGPDTRPRCSHCGKVVFFDTDKAVAACAKAEARGTPMKHYRGKCGHLHVAQIKRRG